MMYIAATHYYGADSTTWLNKLEMHSPHLWDFYLASFYWAWITFSSTGYGDIHPYQTREMIVAIFFVLVSMGFVFYLGANLIEIFLFPTRRIRNYVSMF